MKKGVELSVNFMIILAIAVLAAVVFILFYISSSQSAQGSLWNIKRNISDVLINNTTSSIGVT